MKELAECEVCGKVRQGEDHHVIPGAAGGTLTVYLCRSCHDFIDRQTLDQSDIREQLTGFMDVWRALNVEGRLMLLKLISQAGHALLTGRNTKKRAA